MQRAQLCLEGTMQVQDAPLLHEVVPHRLAAPLPILPVPLEGGALVLGCAAWCAAWCAAVAIEGRAWWPRLQWRALHIVLLRARTCYKRLVTTLHLILKVNAMIITPFATLYLAAGELLADPTATPRFASSPCSRLSKFVGTTRVTLYEDTMEN